jgi:hypothetical protein
MPLVVKYSPVLKDVSAFSSMPDMQNTAKKTPEEGNGGDERRSGARDRRIEDKERRDPERVADEIAPRRHPEIKDRRTSD